MKHTGAIGLAYAVVTGQKQLAELRPFAQAQVKRIITAYGGEEEVKALATYKEPHVKIGHRATTIRKVH